MSLHQIESSLPGEFYFKDNQRKILEKTAKYSEEIFQKALKGGPLTVGGHGRDHWNRVAYIAGNISALEGKSPFLTTLTGLQHDIGRVIQDPRAHNKLHGQLSAETIADFVDSLKGIGNEEKELVLSAIEDHPFLNHEVRESDVVKILMDADRVDGMGAIMVVRATGMNWQLPCYADLRSETPPEKQRGTIFHSIAWTTEWYDMLWTETARKFAKPRVDFMKRFGEEYLKEAQFADDCAKRLGF